MKRTVASLLLFCVAPLFAGMEVEFFSEGAPRKGILALPYRFDGKEFIGIPNRNTRAQASAVVMSFPAKSVTGEIISRHTPRDGRRGMELGLSGRQFFRLDGSFLTTLISSGTRKYIGHSTDGKVFVPEAGEKYLFVLSFIPGKKLTSVVVRLRDRMCIKECTLSAAKVKSLAPGAGSGYLTVGGRIAELERHIYEYPVTAGTVLHQLEVFDRHLTESDIKRLAGGELNFPDVAGDDLCDRKAGDTWCEARRYIDKVSGLPVMQLTTRGIYNQGPTVHYGTAFPGGAFEVSFASIRNGRPMLLTGNIKTGRLKAHLVFPQLALHKRYRSAADIFTGNTSALPILHGINTAASLHHRKVAYYVPHDSGFKMIDLDSGRITVLMDKKDFPGVWFSTPVFSGDGKYAAVCVRGINTDTENSRPTRYCTVELATGKVETAYQTHWGQTHFFSNPAFPDIWAVKQFKPAFMERDKIKRNKIKKTADCYLVDIRSNRTYPLLPRNIEKNITHLEWTGDGRYLVYHGTSGTGGTFLGAMTKERKVVWEYVDTSWSPQRNGLNHICADSVGSFIIDDGLLVKDQISLIDWSNAGTDGRPLVIPLAHWKNQWIPGQFGHPHPAVSPDGNHVVFYGCKDGNTHVYVIDISSVRKRLTEKKEK